MSETSPSMLSDAQNAALERCCAALEEEIARQHDVLDACRRQGQAACARDIDGLETATRDLTKAVNAALRAEAARGATFVDAARGLGIPPHEARMSRLVRQAPDSWRPRLSDIQARLKTVVGMTQRVVEANGRMFRDSARAADRVLAEVLGEENRPGAYDRGGRSPHGKPAVNAVLNVAG